MGEYLYGFCGGLPLSKKVHGYFYVVVDNFRKMCILMPSKKKVTFEQTNHIFFQNVWVHFNLPTSIVSDQNSWFVGNFWTKLWDKIDRKSVV